jgi:hypothetical protein
MFVYLSQHGLEYVEGYSKSHRTSLSVCTRRMSVSQFGQTEGTESFNMELCFLMR